MQAGGGFSSGGGTGTLTAWAAYTGTALPGTYLGLSLTTQGSTSTAAGSKVTTQDAPYNADNNSPAAQGSYVANSANGNINGGGDPLGSAVVFPLLPNGAFLQSWSYDLVAGAAGLANASLPSSNPTLASLGGSATLYVQGSSTYAAVASAPAATLGVDQSTSYGNTTKPAGTATDSFQSWLAYIESFSETNSNGVAVLYIGPGASSASRALVGNLFSAYAAANNLIVDTGTTSDPNGYRYSGNTSTFQSTTTFIAMPVSTFERFINSISPANQAAIGASLAPMGTSNTQKATVQTLVRTGTGGITLAASNNVDLTGGPVTYETITGQLSTTPPPYGSSNQATGYIVGGSAVYTLGHIAAPLVETLTNPDGGAPIVINPESLLPPSLFSNNQSTAITSYQYGKGNSSAASNAQGIAGVLLVDPVYLDGGGNINIVAGQNVLGRTDEFFYSEVLAPGVYSNYQLNRNIYPFIGSVDTPWYVGSVGQTNTVAINPQLFRSGVGALGGGNITINAVLGNISDVTAVADSALSTATALLQGAPSVNQTAALLTFGSGNVIFMAGSNILGGRIDDASGTVLLDAGGNIGAGPEYATGGYTQNYKNTVMGQTYAQVVSGVLQTELSLHISDTTASIEAQGSITIEGVTALAPVSNLFDLVGDVLPATSLLDRFGFYSPVSSLGLLANGSITLTYDQPAVNSFYYDMAGLAFGSGLGNPPNTAILPASFLVTSLSGNINLNILYGGIASGTGNSGVDQYLMVPSPMGELALFAGGNIPTTTIGMLDSNPGVTPGLFSSYGTFVNGVEVTSAGFTLPENLPGTSDVILDAEHNTGITHANDPIPVYVYAEGSIGTAAQGMFLDVSKQARVYAGYDLYNMVFFGQNISSSDITRIVAGHDIVGTTKLETPQVYSSANGNYVNGGPPEAAVLGNTFIIGGPGNFVLEAGRNLGPFAPSVTSQNETFAGGIVSVGNEWDPYLPTTGASLTVLFGVAGGENLTGFREAYLLPGTAANLAGGYEAILAAWMQQNDAIDLMADFGTTTVSPDQAYSAFVKLPEVRQEVFLSQDVFFNELALSTAAANTNSNAYAQGYTAINTLFPASLGYTDNALTGGFGTKGASVVTGSLDLRLATIETQEGGTINVLGPGGKIIAASDVSTAAQAARRTTLDSQLYTGYISGLPAAQITSVPAGLEGLITLRGSNINSFTDGDFELNQSRDFTEQGGNIVIWSSNGNIDAGVGPKTSTLFPPVVVDFDQNDIVTENQLGSVSGAGIATLETVPGTRPGDVYLAAPRGIVNFDDAGLRASGNLTVAAVAIVNSFNINVQGTVTGIVVPPTPNIAAQTTANSAQGAGVKVDSGPGSVPAQQPSIIIVEFLGFGGTSPSDQEAPSSGTQAQMSPARTSPQPGSETQKCGDGTKRTTGPAKDPVCR